MAKKKNNIKDETIKRSPVVAVMGHIDHGKSTLLDYIRNQNTVDSEFGGITQHVAAYEAEHNGQKITFIDTPGHEAFAQARARGANIADIAILVVAADDGVSEQTKGALKFIRDSKIPFIVAINKIDKPNADIQKTKNSLIENEVYLEGMGGDITYSEISALKGTGVSDLLDTLLLAVELEDLKTNNAEAGSGFVLESKTDSKKGISASMIIKNGHVKSGEYIVSGFASAPVRIMEDFNGQKIQEAFASSPVTIIGFDSLPNAGDSFSVFANKKEALKYIEDLKKLMSEKEVLENQNKKNTFQKNKKNVFPIVLRADVSGSLDALKHEMKKIQSDRSEFKIVDEATGEINQNAVKALGGLPNSTIIGFNVKIKSDAQQMAENLGIGIKTFNIIYELLDYLKEHIVKLTPKEKIEETVGEAKILKVFSWMTKSGVVGGEVLDGKINKSSRIKIYRRGEYLGDGSIKELQAGKNKTSTVEKPQQFGMNIATKFEITEGDILKAVEIVEK
ncbi:translation initiation factor IF-2 [Candidatus Campbellbacteria bacterium]|nr:MAG: translation initiation factor IF-2 [Candidatus Campbellbacteria bacterium]